MKKALGALILVALIVVAGVVVLSRYRAMNIISSTPRDEASMSQSNTGGLNDNTVVPATVATLGVGLVPQNDSNMFGGVELEDIGGKTKVTISLTDPAVIADETPHPAHIHTGSCPTPGDVKYPLTDIVNGKSETTINVSLSELAADVPLAVNIHQSAADMGTYLSCGDFPS